MALKKNWRMALDVFALRYNPLLNRSSGLNLRSYYWIVKDEEYATDVVFKSNKYLAAIYQRLTSYAIANFSAEDVLRFFGKRCDIRFRGEVISDIKTRIEGVRIKHQVDENSIKMYDKQGCVLRIETTINNPIRFKVLRKRVRKGKLMLAWIDMRKGIADIYRRVEISRAANARYLDALSSAGAGKPSREVFDQVSRSIVRKGRRYRALHPITPEKTALFKAILRGEHLLSGFRNADLRVLLYPNIKAKRLMQRALGRITRLIRILRAHGLVRKISRSRRYMVTKTGHLLLSTGLTFRESNISI